MKLKRCKILDAFPQTFALRGRSQTTFTRGGGVGGQKNRLFVNIYTIENVNGEG